MEWPLRATYRGNSREQKRQMSLASWGHCLVQRSSIREINSVTVWHLSFCRKIGLGKGRETKLGCGFQFSIGSSGKVTLEQRAKR